MAAAGSLIATANSSDGGRGQLDSSTLFQIFVTYTWVVLIKAYGGGNDIWLHRSTLPRWLLRNIKMMMIVCDEDQRVGRE